MVAFSPTYVIHKVVGGSNYDVSASFALRIIQAPEGDNRLSLGSRAADVRANVTVTGIVDDIIADRPDVSNRQRFGVVLIRDIGRLPRELWGTGAIGRYESIILQIATHIQRLAGA